MLWRGLALAMTLCSEHGATIKARKQWGRFKFKFTKCILIVYHEPCIVLGIVRDAKMKKV